MNDVDTTSLEHDDLDGFYDKFYVYEEAEIQNHLRRLLGRQGGLTARADKQGDSIVTLVLEVTQDSFLVDVPPTQLMLQNWLEASLLRFQGNLDRAALRFSAGPAQLDEFEGRPALRVPVPERVLYLQRREFIRREPVGGALVCRLAIPLPEDPEQVRMVDARISDIGGGGLALVSTKERMPFAVDEVLRGCRITLPEMGEIEVNLLIRHVVARPTLGADMAQAGCQFVDLDPAVQRKLFRYMMQLDRMLVARRWDDD